jgi:hypothetical protein
MSERRMKMDCNEAIKILKDMKGVFGERSHSGYSLPALDLAIKALEKQITKKPVFAGGGYNCQCGWDIYRDKQPYCMMCGQAIDWK